MADEDGLFARFASFYKAAYEQYVRFIYFFYGGELVAKVAGAARPASRETREKSP